MEWLNYHHLLYFWISAREGTISKAAEVLHLTRTTITGQIRSLERAVGAKLFVRKGRRLELTETGRIIYGYAGEIFAIGQELQNVIQSGSRGPTGIRFVVGIPDVVPKLIAHRLLEPALQLSPPVRLVCHEGKLVDLLADLALHRLDLVLSDSPASPTLDIHAYNHKLGECGISFFGAKPLAEDHPGLFPNCLQNAPLLLPTSSTAMRRALDQWMHEERLTANVVAEFEDSALMKVFGQSGLGFFAAPSVIEQEVMRQYSVKLIGRLEDVHDHYYAISVEKRIKHPAVLSISETARSKLFQEE